jgi:hypothetical protein
MSLRCFFGFHDWRRRERTIGVIPPAPGMRPPLPPPREIVEGVLPPRMATLPRPVPMRERFEQCRRCDKTEHGWRYRKALDYPDPKPLPWETP